MRQKAIFLFLILLATAAVGLLLWQFRPLPNPKEPSLPPREMTNSSPSNVITISGEIIPAENFDTITAKVTFYGWVDNDPPGRAIAYPRSRYSQSVHQQGGGVGTYQDPITFAAVKNRFNLGSKVYIPAFKKYFVLEDTCANCSQDHLDIWMDSDDNYPEELLRCERAWTNYALTVILDPLADFSVNTNPFYTTSTGICNR